MATFLTRVQNLVGTVPTSTVLDEWLTAGARYILGIVPDKEALTECQEATGIVTLGLFDKRILLVVGTGGTTLTKVPIDVFNRATSSASYYKVLDPYGYYSYDGRNLVISTTANKVSFIQMPTVANGDSTIVGMMKEWEYGVVLYASKQFTIYQLAALLPPSAPIAPSSPSVSFAALNASQAMGVTLDFLTPLASEFTVIATAITNAITSIANVIIPSPPSTPSAPLFAYSTYSAPVVGVVTLDFVTALSTDLTALGTYMDTNEDIELGALKVQAIQEKIQQYTRQAELTMQKNLADAQASGDNLKTKAASDLDAVVKQYSATLGKFSSDLEKYVRQIQQQVDSSRLNLELSTSELQRTQAKIQQYIKQSELTLQKNLQDASLNWDAVKTKAIQDMQALVEGYGLSMQRYLEQIHSYQADTALYQLNQAKWGRLLEELETQFEQYLMLNFSITPKEGKVRPNNGQEN